MDQTSQPAVSRALFSLTTGLEMATGQPTLEAVGRAKLASVLFDEVIIESGLHVIEMSSSDLPIIQRRNATGISMDLLEHSRTVERGAKFGLAIRITDDNVELYIGTNLPQLDDAEYVVEREVAFRYVSEYHTGLLDDLARLNADWIRVIEIERDDGEEVTISDCPLTTLSPQGTNPEPFAVLHLDADAARKLGEELTEPVKSSSATQPLDSASMDAIDAGPHEQMLAEYLSEAIQVGRRLEAVPAMSSAFERVASERGVSVRLPGAESLGFIVPNFSLLPWEAIAQFRDHPGAVEARGRLREFENEAATRDLPGSTELVNDTGRLVTQALLGVAKDLAPSLPDDLRGPVFSSTVGLIPIVGQYASVAVSMGDVISALRRYQAFEGSWVAAIFELRDTSVESIIDW
jgi:hypothetical protein